MNNVNFKNVNLYKELKLVYDLKFLAKASLNKYYFYNFKLSKLLRLNFKT